MSSTAEAWMRDYVWPEIQTMMLNDAIFRLVLAARQLTGKLKGPTGKLIDDGYVTFQMVTIRRLCDNDEDVFSLRAVLKKAKEEKPNLTEQINQLSSSLGACAHVCDQVNKHVAHTANPEISSIPNRRRPIRRFARTRSQCDNEIIQDGFTRRHS
jgi:hypothetical protein